MTSIVSVAIPARLHRLTPAVVFAAALAFAGTTLEYPVVASAEPQEWDIEALMTLIESAQSCSVKLLTGDRRLL
jgi:type IV pilus biogenesis protein CpaD/CtpE